MATVTTSRPSVRTIPSAQLPLSLPRDQDPEIHVPSLYGGDWYGLMVWLAGALILVLLHLVDVLRAILHAF